MKIFLGIVISAVAAVVVAGFLLSGTPAQERMRKYDQQRVNDLQQISYALDQYANTRGTLPANVDALLQERDIYLPEFKDPVSGTPYEFIRVNDTTYELCATFELDTTQDPQPPYGPNPNFWKHGTGQTCFRFTTPARPLKP